jgi:hypothetical protein
MPKRIKHNDLLPWFLEDHGQLSEAYLKSCRKFFQGIKQQVTSNKRQATSSLTSMGIYSKDKPARREVPEARRSTVSGSVPCQHDGQKKGHKNEN